MLKGFTLGRVDLVGSMGLKRENIETEQITKIAEEVFIKSRNYGFRNRSYMRGSLMPRCIRSRGLPLIACSELDSLHRCIIATMHLYSDSTASACD